MRSRASSRHGLHDFSSSLTFGHRRSDESISDFCSKAPRATDHAYQHKDPDGFAKLDPFRRLRNADHYAMFVYESATGSGTSPVHREID